MQCWENMQSAAMYTISIKAKARIQGRDNEAARGDLGSFNQENGRNGEVGFVQLAGRGTSS